MRRILSLTVILSIALLALTSIAKSDVPQLINYQGRLSENGAPLDDTVQMTFAICVGPSGPNAIWTEDHDSVIVSEGLFNVLLGSVTPITETVFDDSVRYLQITVEGEDITPRTRLVTSPYAFRVSTVDGATGGIISGDVDIQSDLSVSGKATIGPGHTNSGDYAFVAGVSNAASGDYATVGGGFLNTADTNYATVGGGYHNTASGRSAGVGGGFTNSARGNYATIGGGWYNTAGDSAEDLYPTVAGGRYNAAMAGGAFVGGGFADTASEWASTVAGGHLNVASGQGATVGGGAENRASGRYAMIPGGVSNTVSGYCSFAAGRHVKITSDTDYTLAFGYNFSTSTSHAVVFYDSLTEIKVGIQDAAPTNILTVKQNSATDPVADAWTIHSSKEYKRDVHELTLEEYRQALEQVVSVPVVKFHYKGEDAKEKIGLIAEEAPEDILAEGNNKAISLNEYISLLHAALKAQQQELEALKATLKEVDAQSSELTHVVQTMLAKQKDSKSSNDTTAINR